MPYLEVNRTETYYELKGQGKPLIFINGGFISSSMWKPQVDFFSRNYQVILYDVRGHGKTGASEEKNYSVELFAEDLLHLIRKLGVTPPILCGLSLGGDDWASFCHKISRGIISINFIRYGCFHNVKFLGQVTGLCALSKVVHATILVAFWG
ncbi:MAG: alpha/beta fold hydrolase [Candidatus Heimdallarchaeota archaeon]|nr:alpha/beta fold hydrolase [Candidatus Heimdallarchaeota archaeon]